MICAKCGRTIEIRLVKDGQTSSIPVGIEIVTDVKVCCEACCNEGNTAKEFFSLLG